MASREKKALSKWNNQFLALEDEGTLSENSFPFLRLPGEIRNEVYKYALTENEGLCYKYTKSDTTWKLYVYGKITPAESTATSSLLKTSATQKTAIEVPELEVNQLKYVNHQLYSETRGLALTFNKLNFVATDVEHPKALSQALMFTKNISPRLLCHMRRIEIRSDPAVYQEDHERYLVRLRENPAAARQNSTGPHKNLHAIIDFCWANPNIRVDYRFYGLTNFHQPEHIPISDAVAFFIRGCYELSAFRGRDMMRFFQIPALVDSVERVGQRSRGDRTLESLNAPNLQLWPQDDTFDEDGFRKGILGDYWSRQWLAIQNEGCLEMVVKEVRGWYEHGF